MSDGGTRAVLLIAGAPDRAEAERIGEALVGRRLAASGSVLPAVHSFRLGQGRLQREHGALLLVETSRERSEQAQAEIRALHPGPNPEILEVAISGGSATYLAWMLDEVRGS